MRWLALVALVTACGSSKKHGPDADLGNHPPPRVIPGGGIGDGPVDGVVNLYVIDDATRQPVAGATVRVGGMDGTTDATGLFVANDVAGPQQVAVAATGYRSELWLGANGANMTVDVKPAVDPAPASAQLSGQVTGWSAVSVPVTHRKAAIVAYSQDDHATSAENNLQTPAMANICDTLATGSTCSFTITARTGHVALVAAIYDHDPTVTPNTFTLIGWATRTGIVVQNGVGQTGVDLTLVAAASEATMTVALGTPPNALSNVAGLVGLELPTDGVLYLPVFLSPAKPGVLAPMLGAATYRLVGFASGTQTTNNPTAAVILRGQAQTSMLTAPAWLAPPATVSLTRTGGSWSATAGALVQGATYDSDATHHLLDVTAFDGSTTFSIPDLLALPTSGAPLLGAGTALGGTIDVTDFAIDRDLAKITAFAGQPVTVN